MRLIRPGLVALAALAIAVATRAASATVEIASLADLESYAARSGNVVTLTPGVYRVADLLTSDAIEARRRRKEFAVLNFSGSDNTFIMDGVTFEYDTAIRTALSPPLHSNEFIVTGDRNTLRGLTLICTGDGTSPGGALVSIDGDNNTVEDATFHVRGSFPYGYGDLFGKGARPVISHLKHSGFLITGSDTRVIGCRLYMHSFGHGFFVQGGENHYFENCYVEGRMRRTDDMLAETAGPAFDKAFAMEVPNREGKHRVLPDYAKSLSEDGFRTYGQVKNLTFINCTAKNMRGGFELRTREPVRLENCSAFGNERGFWVSGAVMKNCRGDAEYGPLLFVEGNNARIDVTLLPTESDAVIHALALIHGTGHEIRLESADGTRVQPLPIRIGYGTPPAGEGMAAIPEKPASFIRLVNHTGMPIEQSSLASDINVVRD